MKTVLVTGGLGAFGAAVTTHLRATGYHVIKCDCRNECGEKEFLHVDLSTFSQVLEAVRAIRPSVVVHLAATFENEFDKSYATNVIGAKNLLSAIQESMLEARVVLAGSAAEYGLVSAQENPVREDRLLHPVSIYGLTKAWQTTFGLMCSHQRQDVVVARIFNLIGAGLSGHLFAGRIDQQIQDVLAGNRARLEVGSLSSVRDYLPMEEAAIQLRAIMEFGQSGQIYHVASGIPVCMRDLTIKLLSQHGLSFDIVDEHPALSSRVGYDVPVIYADMTRTKALLCGIKHDTD